MTTSPFAVRGVIEGFYGNPWTHEQRLVCVRFIGARGMNTFVYGPKDDPLVRIDWRKAYDGDALARLRELLATCKDAGVELVYCVSPGLSIRYSSAEDLDDLVAKLESVADLGVSRFGLLLDDLPPALLHEDDRAAFADITDAHGALAAAVAARLGPDRSLVVCPLVYWGRGDEDHLRRLGAALDPSVDLFWTGRAICSPTLELDDARRFAATSRRPPLYWDNYPVNDVAMTFELHVGPYRGRDADLASCARGIVANPMELFEASLIPLATIADYLADPAGYDPETSWARAIGDVVGGGDASSPDARAFATFADNTRSSCLATDDAPVVAAGLAAFAFRAGLGEAAEAAPDLAALADGLLDAAARLLRGPFANAALVDECRPWIEAFELGARAIRRTAELAAEGRLEQDARADLVPFLAQLRHRRVRVFGDALDMFLSDITATHVRPGRLLPGEGGGDS